MGESRFMKYGREDIERAQKRQHMYGKKLGRFCLVTIMQMILGVFLVVCLVCVSFCSGIVNGIFQSSPNISTLDVVPVGYATVIYDTEGKETTKLIAADANRSFVSKDHISTSLKDAFVAIEDVRFYEHDGIDFQGIGRAFMVAAQNDFDFSQGASTITQQLLKNNVFTGWLNEDSFSEKLKRKMQEQYLALQLEKKMSKDDILELYMNTINLGQNTLGVQAASMRYFRKPASEITLSEAAVIAAIPQNPSKYNPIKFPENNRERRKIVLSNMLEQGYITRAEYEEALEDQVYVRIKKTNETTGTEQVYTYFVDALTEQIVQDIMNEKGLSKEQATNMLYSGGLKVYSTQDPRIQGICDDIYQDEKNYPSYVQWLLDYQLTVKDEYGEEHNYSSEMLKSYIKKSRKNFNLLYSNQDGAVEDIAAYKEFILQTGGEVVAERINMVPQPQVSLTVEDQNTGFVVAMIGGRGEKTASRTLNRAANTTRQPGSCFKIVSTYAPAIDTGEFSLASRQLDGPFAYRNGRPVSNWWGSGYRGYLNLRYGIKMSCNIVTVKTLTDITPQVGYDYLQDFGFTTLVEQRPTANGRIVSDISQPMALGGITDGVTNMELNAAYATIADYGTYLSPKLYSYILDHDGNVYLDNRNRKGEQVLHDSSAYIIIDAMKDVVTSGTGKAVRFDNMEIAGKTGTTSDNKDVWFAGSTPYYTATCWTGYDNNTQMNSGTGTSLSKSMWKSVMSKIHEDLPYKDWTQPASVQMMSVCPTCGKLREGTGLKELADPNVLEHCNGKHGGSYLAVTEDQDRNDVNVNEEIDDTQQIGTAKTVCAYTGQTPAPECPYQVTTTGEIAPGICPHTAAFMADSLASEVLTEQKSEMQQKNAEAEAAVKAQQESTTQSEQPQTAPIQ